MPILDETTFEKPGESRPFAAHGRLEIVKVGGLTVDEAPTSPDGDGPRM